MSSWSELIPKIEHFTFKLSTEFGHGTGFIVYSHDDTFTVATAWHVIEGLSKVKDKFARRVELKAASGTVTIEANAVGIARLGPEGSDTGVLWIGKPLSTQAVDKILKALARSEIKGGLLDISGGGGIVAITGERKLIGADAMLGLLPRHAVTKGMEVGWIGYPSVASNSPCFFSGRIAGYLESPLMYLIDGTGIPGLSGGPVFDEQGRVLGIVSAYMGPDKATMAGVLASVPIADVDRMRLGYE
jgi:hypothetical protein